MASKKTKELLARTQCADEDSCNFPSAFLMQFYNPFFNAFLMVFNLIFFTAFSDMGFLWVAFLVVQSSKQC
jgi:hypothetical protein